MKAVLIRLKTGITHPYLFCVHILCIVPNFSFEIFTYILVMLFRMHLSEELSVSVSLSKSLDDRVPQYTPDSAPLFDLF